MTSNRFATMLLAAFLFSTTLVAQSRCSLPHYPVAVGDVNEYRTTSKNLDAEGNVIETMSNTYSEEVTSVESDRYVTTVTSAGNANESAWRCTFEGLRVEIPDYPGMSVTMDGVSIPARMDVGEKWTQTYETRGEGFSRKMVTVNRVTAREEVTVEAGTYDAYRVDYEIETITPDEPSSFSRGSQWFVTDVGLVKSTSMIEMPEGGDVRTIDVTIELVKRTTK